MAEPAEYGVGRKFYLPAITAGAQDFKDSPTIAAGDWKISLDGAAYGNLTNLPTSNGPDFIFDLDADELEAKVIRLKGVDTAAKEWDDNSLTIETYGHKSSQHPHIGRVIGKKEYSSVNQIKEFSRNGTLITTWNRSTPGGLITWTPTHA